jgi:hypothetical protein
MNRRRHQDDSKNFEEMNFKEQAQAISMRLLNIEQMTTANLRRAREEGRDVTDVLETRYQQVLTLAGRVQQSNAK